MTDSPQVLLVTSVDHKEGEPGHEVLDGALTTRGITSNGSCGTTRSSTGLV